MKRWLVLMLVAITAAAGFGAILRRPVAEAGPVQLSLPAADGQPPVPGQLAVRPDGKAFALWHVVGGYGLAVWQEGDREAIALSSAALAELAWAPDGLFFAQLTAHPGGQPQILRYRWGAPAPEVVLEGDALKGRPRSLAWRSPGWLYFADDEGLKAARPGSPWTVSRVAGPGIPDTVQYGAFAPGALRYVTVQGGKPVLAEAGRGAVVELAAAADPGLTRVAWGPGGRRVALGFGHADLGGRVLLADLSGRGAPRPVASFDGGSPLFLGERLLFLDPAGKVMEWHESEAVPVSEEPASGMAGTAARGLLYLIRQEPGPAVVQVPLR